MNQRRAVLKMMLGGIAVCASVPALAASEIEVYHSPN